MFSIFKKKDNKKSAIVENPIAIDWAKTENDKYFSLLSLKPEELNLEDFGGVYIVWYTKVKPTAIYIGSAKNLSEDLNKVKDNVEILSFHEQGPLGITWAPIQEKYRNRIISYLKTIMHPELLSIPELDNNFQEEDHIPVVPPFNSQQGQ